MGWSVGGKGYRYTKTAKGRTRTTTSIPGTGISWVKESKGKSSAPSKTPAQRPQQEFGAGAVQKVDKALDKLIEAMPEPKDKPTSYQHWPKKYQWHMKWLAITIVPMFILLFFMPIIMFFPIIGWVIWSLVTVVRMVTYWAIHRSEFKKVEPEGGVIMTDDDKKLDELETELVPTPDIDLSVTAEEPDVTKQVVEAMDK
ncbi:hypothetical protein B6254_2486 (plasmid) [Weissella cibaria]|uniref:DUF4236 domain-containing protein n=1 Tax=Weissella cibaria TaxID=137591 RepID=A0A2S1KV28_9LACO|nr:hypothetical protein B6254_2486 [Weissella cibaria]